MTIAMLDRIGFEVDAIDVFCGFGGSSQGIHAAGATVRAAANHSELALECHAKNFPDTEHWQADLVDSNDPQVLNRYGKKVPGSYLDPSDLPRARFAWFSPACTHHSQANATKIYQRGLQAALFEDDDYDMQAFVNSERSRVTMSCVLRYAAANKPEILVVENVVEVTKWGPGRDGSNFRWWMDELRKLGYEIKPLFLNSMFFGPCPQSRDRVYIVAWKKGNRTPDLDYRPTAYCTSDVCAGRMVEAVQTFKPRQATWAMAEWGKYGAQYDYRCPACRARVHPATWMALHAIDWSNLGPTLAERVASGKRPAANTWERIRRAMEKYQNAPPVVISEGRATAVQFRVNHGQERPPSPRPLTDALGTLTNRNGTAMALTIKNNGDASEVGYRGHHGTEPLGALTGSPAQSIATLVSAGGFHHALVTALFSKINGGPDDTAWHGMDEALNTITGRDTTGLVMVPWIDQWNVDPVHVTEQMATLTARLNHSLATMEPSSAPLSDDDLMGVHFRMLEPDPELRRAMAFGSDYQLIGNKSQMTAGLGNAVTPPVASWITEQCLATLRGEVTA